VKGVFSNLVTVRRSTEQENERISLQDKDYIRQRVWLQLEIAHLSLMQRDQQAFRTSLQRIQESLSTWFDPEDDAYKSIEQEIKRLSAIEVQVDVPDITAPWSTLRMLRAGRSRPVTPVNEVPEEPTEG
jgi:uroporphyrin-3 C-methyltransferase